MSFHRERDACSRSEKQCGHIIRMYDFTPLE
jgi:hypothetical protein